MSSKGNEASYGARIEIDISAQDLMDKYGIGEDEAKKLIADLPNLAKNWLKADAQIGTATARDPLIPPAPARFKAGSEVVPSGLEEWEGFIIKLKKAFAKAGFSREFMPKVMEAISVDDLEALTKDVMEAISVDKTFIGKLKRILRRAKIPGKEEIKVMEAISVDTADWAEIPCTEEDVMEAISVDKAFKEKLLKVLRKAKLSKEHRVNVMEAISVDEADVSEAISVDKIKEILKRALKRANIPKEYEIKVSEAISVDIAGVPKTNPERAMAHFNIAAEAWNKLDEERQKEYIKALPELGSGRDEKKGEKKGKKVTKEMAKKFKEMGLEIEENAILTCVGPGSECGGSEIFGSTGGSEIADGYFDSLDIEFVQDSLDVKDGILKAHAICAAVMIQDYNGLKVLKCPDELKLAVDFAKSIPITDGHPPGGLVRNQKEYKGWANDLTWNDEKKRIECDIVITDGTLIKKIQDGMTDVSIGFFCDLDRTSGKITLDNKEVKYDAIQRNIVLNHLATGVAKGRCPEGTCGIGQDSITTDTDVTTHEKMLQEKVDALKALGDSLASGAATMKPEEIQAKVSMMSEIAWNLRQLTDVINVKEISVSDEILKTVNDSLSLTEITINDSNKTLEDGYNMALDFIEKEKAAIIDSIMDMKPPKTRGFFEDMNLVALKDVKALMDSQKDGEGIDFSGSANLGQDAVDEAYSKYE